MRREAAATDPLAQITAPHQAAQSVTAPQPPTEQGTPLPQRAAQSTTLTPDESAEFMTNAFASRCRKLPVNPSAVPADLNGLQTLARSSAWKHVVELASKINDSSKAITINLPTKLRLEGLFRLKMFDDLAFETTNLLSSERMKLLLNTDGAEAIKNSNNVYAMQLLLSEVKAMTGNSDDAFQDLCELRRELEEEIATIPSPVNISSHQWWLWRVTSSIINTAIRQRLWRMALAELTGLLDSMRTKFQAISSLDTSSSSTFSESFRRVEVIILCHLSRILLQIGAMKSSALYFAQATKAVDALTKDNCQRYNDVCKQVEVTRGLMLFGKNEYEKAMTIFCKIIDGEKKVQVPRGPGSDVQSIFDAGPVDGPSLFWKDEDTALNFTFDSVMTLEESVLSAAVNNYSICALYLRRVKEAITRLEELIKDDPVCSLIDPIVFNLCTLYDLSCSADVSVMRKLVLQKLSVRYHVDDPMLHWRSFRLN